MNKITIGERVVGGGEPTFVIAEAGVNHDGELAKAYQLVDIAADLGADAVKFQTFIADKSITPEADKANYQKATTGNQESQLQMVKRLELSFADFRNIKTRCESRGITFLSTPFDFESVDFLHDLGVPALKVSSGDLTNHPLLRHIAATKLPVILSTGMSNMDEVEAAVNVVRSTRNDEIILLQCVTNYPAAAADVNLKAMLTMKDFFQVPVGYSDHTLGTEVALAAVALGATVIEKHFTLSKDSFGPDHRASLEPQELRFMIEGIRKVEAALGSGIKIPAASEADNAAVARRSMVAAVDIVPGTIITADKVALKRPGTGMPPKLMDLVLGKTARVNIRQGTLLAPEMFE